MKIVRFLILSTFIYIIPGISLGGGSPSLNSLEIPGISDGPDFCLKLTSFLKDLNQETPLNVTLTECSTIEDGWLSDKVKVLLMYRHKNCLEGETYFRPIQFSYMGIYYIDAIKQIIEDVGLKFISQTNDNSVITKANNGEFQISIGIPRCMEN